MIVVATTLPPFVMTDPGLWGSWLTNGEAIRASRPDVRFFAALEQDSRGIEEIYNRLLRRLDEDLDGDWWTFRYDDKATRITTQNRVRRINAGFNMAIEYAIAHGASHLLICSGDTVLPADVLPKLLEVNADCVGAECPSYALTGPDVSHLYDGIPVQDKLATVAAMLIERDAFRRVRFRNDPDVGMTDDPAYRHDLHELGMVQVVRTDVIARHYPEILVPLEDRGLDTTIR